MGRALAHGMTDVTRFSDPTALAMLPAEARRHVERIRAGVAPRGLRDRIQYGYLRRLSQAMIARTVAIDDAIRTATTPQVVILGAGLDGRAWRMPELKDALVFEVDHPDSQREKRAAVGALARSAREVRFLAVDFTRDSLGEALERAGHDVAVATTWVWEGVVMYLWPAEVARTLGVLGQRSAPGSRLIATYHAPAVALRLFGLTLRRIGEPLRSRFTPQQMGALLARHRWTVRRDDDIPTIAAALSARLAHDTRMLRHFRIVVADRVE